MDFELLLKGAAGSGNPYCLYSGSYKFCRVSYDIDIFEDMVRITRKAGANRYDISRKNAEDAIRKAYILYALQMGKGLEIQKFHLGKISDKKVRDKDFETYDEDSRIPFVVSMLRNSMLIHEEKECDGSSIFRNRKIMKYVADSKRSDYQSDKRMIALFAYLISRSREYEMDRFINQWTAINAIYDELIDSYGHFLTDEIKKLMKDLPEKDRLSDKRISEIIDLPESDNQKVLFISRYMQAKKQIRSKRTGSRPDRDCELGKLDNTWLDDFKYFICAKKYDGGKRVSYECRDMEKVCLDAGWESYDWGNEVKQEAYERLRDSAKGSGCTLYAFLTFLLPYHIRNDYIHGSMAALIFSDAYNVNKLAMANYFMDSFITGMLPVLFDGTEMYKEILQIHEYHFSKIMGKLKNDKNSKDQDIRNRAKQNMTDLQKIKGLITKDNKSLTWLKRSL